MPSCHSFCAAVYSFTDLTVAFIPFSLMSDIRMLLLESLRSMSELVCSCYQVLNARW